MSSKLASPITLPSGLVLENRTVKAAMAEGMAVDSEPNDKYFSSYTSWAAGGWGGLLTGNVDVSTVYRGSNETIAIKPSMSQASRDAWERWANVSQREGTPTIIQLVHPGRQSPVKAGERGFFDRAIAPSALPLNIGDGLVERLIAKLAFGTPEAMTTQQIDELIQQFATAAKIVYEAGFKGVQLHGAHGYLLSAFLSPKSNIRTDAYGGTAAKRARVVIEVIRAVRAVVPASFTVGIKLNSADVGGAESLEESLEQVDLIAKEQIDFIEISGGSYENPRMAAGDDPKAMRTAKREAFFLDYARSVRERHPNIVLMVTGGFRSRKGMEAALESGAVDLVGIGRPAAVYPHLPKDILLNKDVSDADAVVELPLARPPWLLRLLPIKLIGAGADTMWYVKQIHAIALGKTPVPPPKQ